MSRGIEVVYLMSGYDELMQRIGRASSELSILASTVRELQLSHDRLLAACGEALACIDDNPVARDLLREVIGKAPRP